jgi:pyruvate dehydrogenase E1 component beta subunit
MSATGEAVQAMTYREALREAMSEAMRADDRVFLMGEDVGPYGGSFGVSRGMLDEFGPDRVRDTPLSEAAFVGAGVGAAMGGMLPIVEIMTVNFSLLALDQIVNNAATIPHMSGGQVTVPLVVRMTTGAGRQLAAQHSHSLEGWYAHVPGLKVVAPATVPDARWMLGQALADPNPVIVFEHGSLYNRSGELPADPGDAADITRAAIRRPGADVSLITYGQSLWTALEAAEALAADGIDAEVLDLRVLRPLDVEAIVASVARTHRAVVIDEMWRTGSLAAEISALITERAFYELDAPVARVCTEELPIPYAGHLEQAAIPSAEGIRAAARGTVDGDG